MESSDKRSLKISSSTKRRQEKGSDLVETIHNYEQACLEVELSKQKMDLMQHQEKR